MPHVDESELLLQASSALEHAELSLGSSLPLVALGCHLLLALLGGGALSLLLRCQKLHVSRRRFLAYTMRVSTELQSMTLITAAALTVVELAKPNPIPIRVGLLFSILLFSTVTFLLYGYAFMRFTYAHNRRSERVTLRDAEPPTAEAASTAATCTSTAEASDSAAEDTALCFYLNNYFGSCPMALTRAVLMALVLGAMLVALATSSHDTHSLLVTTPLLFLLVLHSSANLLRPALSNTHGKDYKHILEAARSLDGPSASAAAPSKRASGSSSSTPGRAALACGTGWLRGATALLMPPPSREVVLRISAAIGWHEEDNKVWIDGEMAPAPAGEVYEKA